MEKLATLAVQAPAIDEESDIARLTEACQRSNEQQLNGSHNGILKSQTPTSRVPMVCPSMHSSSLLAVGMQTNSHSAFEN